MTVQKVAQFMAVAPVLAGCAAIAPERAAPRAATGTYELATAIGYESLAQPVQSEPAVEPGHPDHKSGVNAAEAATDPSAVLAQLGFFYWNTQGEEGNPDSEAFLFQPVLPLSKNNVLRPALALQSIPGTDRVTGIGDLLLLDIFLFQAPNASWGIGPVLSLPTASEDQFGSGKYEAGVSAMYMYKGVPKSIFGLLGYNLTSFAGEGDRADVNRLFFQPIVVTHFDWGYLGWTDQLGTVDWEDSNEVSFPLGFRVGKVFGAKGGKTLLNVTAGPYYTANSDSPDDYGFKISATFVKPAWLKH